MIHLRIPLREVLPVSDQLVIVTLSLALYLFTYPSAFGFIDVFGFMMPALIAWGADE